MSTTEGSIDGENLYAVAHAVRSVKHSTIARDTEVTWLGGDGGPYGAIVTPDVVEAAKHYWREIAREMEKSRGLPKI